MRIERYGSGDPLYLVLHNPGDEDVTAELVVDAYVLGRGEFKGALRHYGGDVRAPEPIETQGGRLRIAMSGKETCVAEL